MYTSTRLSNIKMLQVLVGVLFLFLVHRTITFDTNEEFGIQPPVFPYTCGDYHLKNIKRLGFDANKQFVKLGSDNWGFIRYKNPLDVQYDHNLVPTWPCGWKKSVYKCKFGGLTADMGWPLMVARFALQETSKGVEFMGQWGHGCVENTRSCKWDSFFKPLPNSKKSTPVLYSNKTARHMIKMYKYYDSKHKRLAGKRNDFIIELAGMKNIIQPDNDLQTMRIVFTWLYQLNSSTRHVVDVQKKKVFDFDKPYIAMHVRWGDKVGRGGGPKETSFIPLKNYIQALDCHFKSRNTTPPTTIFVATDDYSSVEELRKMLPSFKVYTSAESRSRGFSIDKYRETVDNRGKYFRSVNLWADMEILANADVVAGNMGSNVLRMVHLMREDHDPDTTIDVAQYVRNGYSCCNGSLEDRRRNCFWLCV